MEPPSLSCPTDLRLATDPGENWSEVTWIVPEAEDNSKEALSMRVIPAILPPKRFPLGKTQIKYIAEDTSGNQATCSFVVEVFGK